MSTPRPLLSYRRPWRDLITPSTLSFPTSYTETTTRLRRNLPYFRYNYTYIILLTLFLSLISHPVALILFLCLFSLWYFLYLSRDTPITLPVVHYTVDDRVLLVLLSLGTVVALGLARVGVNVLIGLAVGLSVVFLHAACRSVDDHFLTEDDVGEDNGLVASEGVPLRPGYASRLVSF